jgi:hypothetical protein
MAKNKINDWNAAERKMRRFLNADPIPDLTGSEVQRLTFNVLQGKHVERELHWYQLRTAYKVAFAASILLAVVFVATNIKPDLNIIQTAGTDYNEAIFEQYEVEDVLIEAISVGDIDEDEAFAGLIGVDAEELESAYETYRDDDIDSRIERLSEEEAQEVLDILDKLGYPDKEEA